MEKVNIFQMNLDYELQLFQAGSLKVEEQSLFEFVFFFLSNPDDVLSTKFQYSEEYLNYLQKYLDIKPKLTHEKANCNFWGKFKNIELEQKLNSKLTSTEFAISKKLAHPETKIINTSAVVPEVFLKKYVFKNPYQMSGKGFMFVDNKISEQQRNWLNKELSKNLLILEPWLDRKFDLGVRVSKDKNVFYQNFVSERGHYKGTKYSENNIHLISLFNNCKIPIEVYYQQIELIKNYYFSLGATDEFSIDSFIYLEDGVYKLYTLAEVNYRHSMGELAFKVNNKINNIYGETIILTNKNRNLMEILDKLGDFHFNRSNRNGILILSPPNLRFLTLYLSANSESYLADMKIHLLSLF